MAEQQTRKKDINIGKKYLAKDNSSFVNDYFGIITIAGMGSGVLFLNKLNFVLIPIGIVIILVNFYLYKQKDRNIITSVTLYKYKEIFLEILFKSFKFQKMDVKKFKNMLFKKK